MKYGEAGDSSDGIELSVEVSAPGQNAFYNHFTSSGTAQIPALKVMDGRKIYGSRYTFRAFFDPMQSTYKAGVDEEYKASYPSKKLLMAQAVPQPATAASSYYALAGLNLPLTEEETGNTYVYVLYEVPEPDAEALDADWQKVEIDGDVLTYEKATEEQRLAYRWNYQNVTYDNRRCMVRIYDIENVEGKLNYKIEISDGENTYVSDQDTSFSGKTKSELESALPVFRNVFRVETAELSVPVSKHIVNRRWLPGQHFTFKMKSLGIRLEDGTIDASIRDTRNFTEASDYTKTISVGLNQYAAATYTDQTNSFRNLTYTQENVGKTYVYLIWEEETDRSGYTFSKEL